MRNRSLIALSAVGIHLSIGSVYAFSVLVRPIMETLGASMGDVTWTFSLAILFLGMSAALLGRFVEKIGPQKSGLMAAFFFGTGLLGTAYALSIRSLSPPLSLLWVHWRHWSWHRLHHTRINLGEIFSPPPRFCNRSCHHGLWFCRSHCSSPHAATHPHGGPYPHLLPHGRCLLGHHGPLCPLPQTARPEKGT